jgi:hypothetical protein
MKHPSNRELFDYWNLCRGPRSAPDRADIEPGAIRRVLADTFILSYDAAGGHPFRIAGTRVCALFGRELKTNRFLDLWSAQSRDLAQNLLFVVAHETVGAIASANGRSSSGSMHDLEVLLLPLRHRGRTDDRVLGALVPNGASHWLGAAALGQLTLGTLRYLGEGLETPAPPLAPARRPEGRIRRGFTIYDGGQA